MTLKRGLFAVLLGLSTINSARAESIFGVATHFLHTNEFYREQKSNYWAVQSTLPALKELGARTVSDGIYAFRAHPRALVSSDKTLHQLNLQIATNRQSVERSLAAYQKEGTRIVLGLMVYSPKEKDYQAVNQDYADWIATIVKRFENIKTVQLHNEPAGKFWNGTSKEYVEVYTPIVRTIKAARPDVEITVGATSSLSFVPEVDWLKRAMSHGLMALADAVSVHPYNKDLPPEIDPHFKGAPVTDLDQQEKAFHAFWATVQRFNTDKKPLKLYFTEYGYPSSGKNSLGSEARQADYLSRAMLIYQDLRVRGLPIGGAYWYDFKDDGVDPENPQHNFGLVTYDLSRKKPAFYAYRDIIADFPDVTDLRIDPAIKAEFSKTDHLKHKVWVRRSDGAVIVAFWRVDQFNYREKQFGRDRLDEIPTSDFGTELSVSGAAGVQSASLRVAGKTGVEDLALQRSGDVLRVKLTATTRAAWVVFKRR